MDQAESGRVGIRLRLRPDASDWQLHAGAGALMPGGNLISGKFRVDLTGGSETLNDQGDYVMWQPGIDHSWEALSTSTVLTVRWPSESH
ncbi:hypothetical protein AB0C38_13815 [Amycolatopsis sp. NPDC048633]|uniref:hypothetical protein n=1 Tax=Amycolatopsis sp. NPDC048633 TaxID=3157095 RepID=UPI0033D575F2